MVLCYLSAKPLGFRSRISQRLSSVSQCCVVSFRAHPVCMVLRDRVWFRQSPVCLQTAIRMPHTFSCVMSYLGVSISLRIRVFHLFSISLHNLKNTGCCGQTHIMLNQNLRITWITQCLVTLCQASFFGTHHLSQTVLASPERSVVSLEAVM